MKARDRSFAFLTLVQRSTRGPKNDDREIACVVRCSELTIRNCLLGLFQNAEVTRRAELAFHALSASSGGMRYARKEFVDFEAHLDAD